MGGRILKTVDSVYQDVQTVEECRELCLNSPFRCHSYDHGDTGDHVCRLSHHSRATLADIQVLKALSNVYKNEKFIIFYTYTNVFLGPLLGSTGSGYLRTVILLQCIY